MKIGDKNNRLLYIKESPKRAKSTHKYGYFLCDCGKTKEMLIGHVKYGRSKSCGCYHKEVVSREDGLGVEFDLYSTYRSKAKERDYSFELALDEFLSLTKQDCFYCGQIPSNVKKNPRNGTQYVYNGVDRKDNSLGYISTNVVPCCIDCNRSKSVRSYDDYLDWITKSYKRLCESRF